MRFVSRNLRFFWWAVVLFSVTVGGVLSVLIPRLPDDAILSNYRDDDGYRVTDTVVCSLLRSDYYTVIDSEYVPIVSDSERCSVVSFQSDTLNGSVLSSDDLRGADLIVYFRWADWCSDCDTWLAGISDFLEQSDTLVEFVGVPYISGGLTTEASVQVKLSMYPILVDDPRFHTVLWEPIQSASVFGVCLADIPYVCLTTGSGAVLWRGSVAELNSAFDFITTFTDGASGSLFEYLSNWSLTCSVC